MDLEKIWAGAFGAARRLSQEANARYVVLVKPDRTVLAVACPPAGSIPEEEAAKVGAILPNDVPRNVTVIAPTEFDPGPSTLAAAAEALRAGGAREVHALAAARSLPGSASLRAAGRSAYPRVGSRSGLWLPGDVPR